MQQIAVSRLEPSALSDNTEYVIYAYDSFEDEKLGANHWQLIASSKDCEEMVSRAETLFNAAQYQKIEIKQKTFSSRKGKHIASTYKIYEQKPDIKILPIVTILLIAFSLVGLIYLENM